MILKYLTYHFIILEDYISLIVTDSRIIFYLTNSLILYILVDTPLAKKAIKLDTVRLEQHTTWLGPRFWASSGPSNLTLYLILSVVG